MRRGRLLIFAIAVLGLLVGTSGIDVAAANSPGPASPPGMSAGTQPASASIGSSAQRNSSANVASGRTSSTAQGQDANHSTCGAGVGIAGNAFAAQPTQAGTSGTSTPPNCASEAATGSSVGQSARPGQIPTSSGSASASTSTHSGQATDLVSVGMVSPTEPGLLANAGKLGWLLLAILLAFLFFLFGAAAARKRQPVESA